MISATMVKSTRKSKRKTQNKTPVRYEETKKISPKKKECKKKKPKMPFADENILRRRAAVAAVEKFTAKFPCVVENKELRKRSLESPEIINKKKPKKSSPEKSSEKASSEKEKLPNTLAEPDSLESDDEGLILRLTDKLENSKSTGGKPGVKGQNQAKIGGARANSAKKNKENAENDFNCLLCEKRFISGSNRDRHVREVHS